MAIELITCTACGTKNASHRTLCFSCGADLATSRDSLLQHGEGSGLLPASQTAVSRIGTLVKNMTLEQALKLSIIAAVLLVGISASYYYLIFLPRLEKTKSVDQVLHQMTIENKELEAKVESLFRAESLSTCLTAAFKDYEADWANNCKGRGSDCSLPRQLARDLDDRHQRSRDECFRMYPQK